MLIGAAFLVAIPGFVVRAEELGGAGTFQHGTLYGTIWFPRDVGPGWAPYHNGRWVNFEGRWGWIPTGAAVVLLPAKTRKQGSRPKPG